MLIDADVTWSKGKGNPKCPTKVPHPYCVMDYFHITHVWAERVNRRVSYQYRFEKLALDKASWWAPEASPDPPTTTSYAFKAERLVCGQCGHTHPRIYQEGWMCLNPECDRFWTLDRKHPCVLLHYNEDFLHERTEWDKNIRPPYALKPELPAFKGGNNREFSVSRLAWKGIACSKCGCCLSRVRWQGWACQSVGCDFTYTITHQLLAPRAVLGAHNATYAGHALPLDAYTAPVRQDVRFSTNFRIHTYTVPGCGMITHFMANDAVNKATNGPDDMFLALQQADVGLTRFPLKSTQGTETVVRLDGIH